MTMPSRGRLATGTILSALACLVMWAAVGVRADDAPGPLESTSAYKLLKLEGSVRQIPPDAMALLRGVLDDATNAAIQKYRHPQTPAEAIAALEAIQLALVKHNFIQPPEEKDWPNTIGIAFEPLQLSAAELDALLAFSDNVVREPYVDRAKPFYFVDCDMGSQLFMAVGERLGWDIRLVELPQHNFVRWHLTGNIKINWDWTHGQSIADSDYPSKYDDVRLQQVYLRSLAQAESWAYYVGLIASEATKPADAERLFLEAVTVIPHHPLTLNNFAWLYATNPEFKSKSGVAVAYALAAWSMRPAHGNFADTTACSLSVNGQKALAIAVEEFAIAHPNDAYQSEGFRKNLARIKAGELCK